MKINPVQMGSVAPSNAELHAGAIGEPANQGRILGSSFSPVLNIEPSRTGGDWVPDSNWCREKTKSGAACKAKPIKGTDLCVGHTRKLKAQEARKEA